MSQERGGDARFAPLFARWAARVRRRLALRHALTGAAIGLAVAMVPAAAAWKTRHGALRPYAPLVGVVGAAAGLAVARRKRWSDTDVALYLDARLATEETIATAIGLTRAHDRDDGSADRNGGREPHVFVVTRAAEALAQNDAKEARPAVWKPIHALAPIAIVGLVAVARAPLPAAPVSADPPGTARVQMTQAEGLERVAKIAQLSARDAAQRERLDKIAHDAEKLKEELRAGLEKRDAQDKIARLEDAIAAERLSLGDGEKRAGLESAVGRLEETDATKRAARALGDHDLETMDSEMERLANQREKQDRELAKQALEDAASRAKKSGAPDVGKALEDEKKLMERRSARADALRDLADAMKGAGEDSEGLRTESEALDRQKSDAAARKLAQSMADALEKLTPEERKHLAERLREMAKRGGVQRGDADTLKDLADDLATPEGKKRLEERLKEMANDATESDESERQKGLDDAQDGAEDTEKGLGDPGKQGQGKPGEQQGQQGQGQGKKGQGQTVPVPQSGSGSGSGNGSGKGNAAGNANGSGNGGGGGGGDGAGGGGGHDFGTGDHGGATGKVDAQTLKSRAKGPMNPGQAMPGTITTFSAGKAGGTANQRGTGDLRVVGPKEIDGVDRSDVPEEYRDHVRQYFQP
jgi:hypothetical protein